MATSPETTIENVLITQISALSYISTNSIPVRSPDDMDEVKDAAFVNVSCGKAGRIAPNYNYYRTEVEVTCMTHIPNDENQAVSENLYSATNNYVQGLAASVLNTAVTDATITIDGIVPTENDDEYDDKWRAKVVRADVFYTYVQST